HPGQFFEHRCPVAVLLEQPAIDPRVDGGSAHAPGAPSSSMTATSTPCALMSSRSTMYSPGPQTAVSQLSRESTPTAFGSGSELCMSRIAMPTCTGIAAPGVVDAIDTVRLSPAGTVNDVDVSASWPPASSTNWDMGCLLVGSVIRRRPRCG